MRNNLQSIAILLAAARSIAPSVAFEPSDLLRFQKGPAVLKPQFDVNETFNDNVTYASDNLKSDFITTLSPGLALQLGRRTANYLDFTYFYDRLIYVENSEFDANQHHITAGLRLEHQKLTLTGDNHVEFLSGPIGGGYSALSGQNEGVTALGGSKVDRTFLYNTYRLNWEATDRTSLYVQSLHSLWDYQNDLPLYDSQTLSGTLGFEYHPLTKIYFFGEIYGGQTENTRNQTQLFDYPTATFIGFFGGARGQFTEKLRGTAKAGFEHRMYEDDRPAEDAPVVDISLDEQLTDRTLISVSYSRRQYESIQFASSSYTTDAITVLWNQNIRADERLHSILRLSYLASNFGTVDAAGEKRSDDMITAGLTLTYDVKLWMRAFGSYNFEYLNSSADYIVDYKVNRVTVGLQIGY